MGAVPTTETATDRMQAAKTISEMTARLIAVKDKAERETNQAQEAASAAHRRVQELSQEITNLEEKSQETARATALFFAHCESLIREAAELTGKTIEMCKKVDTKILIARQELEKIELRAEEVNKRAVFENEQMDKKMHDLRIYQARLEKEYADKFPGQRFIV